MNFDINLIFLIKPFFYMPKKSRQKLKYPDSEKSFSDEVKNIFYHFLRAIIKANKEILFGGWESDFENFWISWNIWKKYAIPVRLIFLYKLRQQDSMIYFQGITWILEQLIIKSISLRFLFRLFFYCLIP